MGYGHGLGYYGKRSAEAEPTAAAEAKADPYYGYYGQGYHGLGYGRAYGYGLGHYGYAGLGHYGGYYGHGLGYYGKRSAEAEPTAAAEAKADPYYGYYGHGY